MTGKDTGCTELPGFFEIFEKVKDKLQKIQKNF